MTKRYNAGRDAFHLDSAFASDSGVSVLSREHAVMRRIANRAVLRCTAMIVVEKGIGI